LIGGWQDSDSVVETYILLLYRSLQANGVVHLGIKIHTDEHSFTRVRKGMQKRFVTWMKLWD